MKTGVIVYVLGSEPKVWDQEDVLGEVKQNTSADLVEIITDQSGHQTVSDAWRMLLARGMKRICCMTGEFTEAGSLQLTGRELRLCG